MSRGRKGPPFDAMRSIKKFEQAVFHRMVTIDFTADDVLELFCAPEALRCLRAAYPYTQQRNSNTWDADFTIGGGTIVHINIDPSVLKCLTPHDVTVEMAVFNDIPAKVPFLKAMADGDWIVQEHNVLRRIVTWLNNANATPSFARYYFPALGSLLPGYHPFHETDGSRFRDYPMPHHIATDLRRAPEIVAKGLFCCPDERYGPEGTPFSNVKFGGGDEAQWFTLFTR